MKKLLFIFSLLVCSNIFGQGFTDTITNFASLRALTPKTGQIVSVQGYWTKGDGGGGLMYWDSASTATIINGWVDTATGISTGRWERQWSGSDLNIRWFGAKGDSVTDDRIAIQNAVNTAYNLSVVSVSGGKIGVYAPAGDYYVSSNLTYNTNVLLTPGTHFHGDGDNTKFFKDEIGSDTLSYFMGLYNQSSSYPLSADSTENNYYIHDFQVIGGKGRHSGNSPGQGADGGIFINSPAASSPHVNIVRIYNVTVRNMNKEGITVWAAAMADVHDNHVYNDNFDAYDMGWDRTVLFTNNFADSINVGLEIAGANSFSGANQDSSSYINIGGGAFTNVFEGGINLEGGTTVMVHDMILAGAANDSTTLTYEDNGIIITNTIFNNGYPVTYGFGDLMIDGVTFKNFVNAQISTNGSPASNDAVTKHLGIRNCNFDHGYSAAIALNPHDTTKMLSTDISNNHFKDWDVQNQSASTYCAIILSNIKNVSITAGNTFENTNPANWEGWQTQCNPLSTNGNTDSILFARNTMKGKPSNGSTFQIMSSGTGNIGLQVWDNPGLDSTKYSQLHLSGTSQWQVPTWVNGVWQPQVPYYGAMTANSSNSVYITQSTSFAPPRASNFAIDAKDGNTFIPSFYVSHSHTAAGTFFLGDSIYRSEAYLFHYGNAETGNLIGSFPIASTFYLSGYGATAFSGTQVLVFPTTGSYGAINATANGVYIGSQSAVGALTVKAYLELGAGVSTKPALVYDVSTLLSTTVSGAAEYSGVLWQTNNAAQRGEVIAETRTTVNDAAYTIVSTDFSVCYTAISASRAITLPSASSVSGQHFLIKDESGSASATKTITIAGTIDGASNPTIINAGYGKYRFYSNGSAFFSE